MIYPVGDANFEKEVLQVANKGVLVDFWAKWCGPCKALAPKLEELAEKTSGVKFVKVDVEEAPNTAAQFGIRGLPTLAFFKQGQIIDQLMGNQSQENIQKFIQKNQNSEKKEK